MRRVRKVLIGLVFAVGILWRGATLLFDWVERWRAMWRLIGPWLSPLREWTQRHPNWDAIGPWLLIGAALMALVLPHVIVLIRKFLFEYPLEIIFDFANPEGRFWSDETWYHDNGEPVGYGTEYRFEIKNRSNKTLFDVEITQEHLGGGRSKQTTLEFKRTGRLSCNMHPMSSEFVKAFLIGDSIKTMPVSDDALTKSGVIIRARARDVPEITKRWRFNPTTEPVLYAEWPLGAP